MYRRDFSLPFDFDGCEVLAIVFQAQTLKSLFKPPRPPLPAGLNFSFLLGTQNLEFPEFSRFRSFMQIRLISETLQVLNNAVIFFIIFNAD